MIDALKYKDKNFNHALDSASGVAPMAIFATKGAGEGFTFYRFIVVTSQV